MSAVRRRLSRRSALALVWAIAAFALAQLVLGLSVERWLPEVRDPQYVTKLRMLRALQASHPDQPLILAMGSSRTQTGLRAGDLHAIYDGRSAVVFNFGLPGGGSFVEVVCLRRLLRDGIRPDLILLEVLPPTLNQPGKHSLEEQWFDAARLRSAEMTFLGRYHTDTERLRRQWLKGRLPCVWHADRLHLLLAPESPGIWPGTDDHGWMPYSGDEVPPERRIQDTEFAHQQYAASWGDFRLASGPSQALDDILDACRQQAIPVALLLMPEGPTFRAHYSPSMRAGITAHLQAVSRTYHVPLIDARDWLPDDAFGDSHHLLPHGAAAFTKRFEREALTPLLQTISVAAQKRADEHASAKPR
jgi:hypothetical protein